MASLPKINENQNIYTSDRMDDLYISIPQFYAGRSVFITGGTGFMGKILVEKLLRSCTGIEHIYILMRPKRGQEVAARLENLLNSAIFDTVRRERSHELKKVVAICGDVTFAHLGISESDQELLCRSVSVVYHLAATVKFDEKLGMAVRINMLGTRSLLELCHRMQHLDALVHVSTAYCHCDRSEIREVSYPPPYDPENIINLVSWLPESLLDNLTPSLIGQRPNTYTFTKALAEQMMLEEAGNLPIAIVRPSIVVACYNEPIPGWSDCYSGPNFLLTAIGNGLLHTLFCEKNFIADLIPVDFVVNLIITAAWRTSIKKPNDIIVYNCVNDVRQPITWQEFVSKSVTQIIQYPMEGAIWYPHVALHTNRLAHTIIQYLVQYLPAYILDCVAWSTGKRQIFVKAQNQIRQAAESLKYFITNQWRFTNDNVRELLSHMSDSDRTTFHFDVTRINWNFFFEPFAFGLRKFLLKQSSRSLPNRRNKMTRLYFLHQTSKVVLAAFSIVSIWRVARYLFGLFW